MAISYKTHPHGTDANGQGYLTVAKEKYPLQVFGNHNYQNISAAKELLKKIGVSAEQFLKAIGSFKGAAGRLEKIASNDTFTLYKDFAHAPSKVKATVKAVKDISANREVVACYELHTFSSLNKNFLPQYKNALKDAKTAIVYINPEKVKAKNLPAITAEEVKKAFHNDSIVVFEDTQALESYLLQQSWKNKNLVMMSSGNFGGLDIKGLATKLIA
jgi:UDP-N-acetylmuramate: L-alanyl-gamma-D-glutamyl-meso-diaminopimelate ligase